MKLPSYRARLYPNGCDTIEKVDACYHEEYSFVYKSLFLFQSLLSKFKFVDTSLFSPL
jgi:hypothetical protein